LCRREREETSVCPGISVEVDSASLFDDDDGSHGGRDDEVYPDDQNDRSDSIRRVATPNTQLQNARSSFIRHQNTIYKNFEEVFIFSCFLIRNFLRKLADLVNLLDRAKKVNEGRMRIFDEFLNFCLLKKQTQTLTE
jgi:hypothetical protein